MNTLRLAKIIVVLIFLLSEATGVIIYNFYAELYKPVLACVGGIALILACLSFIAGSFIFLISFDDKPKNESEKKDGCVLKGLHFLEFLCGLLSFLWMQTEMITSLI